MLCDNCKHNEATVLIKEIRNAEAGDRRVVAQALLRRSARQFVTRRHCVERGARVKARTRNANVRHRRRP